MPQLFIDRGNTALKWQVIEAGNTVGQGRVLNEVSLDDAFNSLTAYRFSNIYVASVAGGDFRQHLTLWAKQSNQPCPYFVESSSQACGVINGYKEANQLGVDRWLALIAAHHNYSGMLCVVDSGTALTMDFLTGNGQHLGGYIVPGSELMKKSLLANTQKIKVQGNLSQRQLGCNTTEAVLLGIENMLQAFVSKKLEALELECKQQISVIFTGGHAEKLAAGLPMPVHLEKDLVIRGLRLLIGSLE